MRSKIIALTKKEEFKNLIKKKMVSNKYATIFFGSLKGKDINKLNISFVTKKKIGNAVKRNKIKRRLRNIMNDAIKSANMDLNYSYLFIAKKNVYDAKYKMIKDSIFKDLNKIR